MALPLVSQFTLGALILTSTLRIPPLGAEHPEHAQVIILEVVGSSTPDWTLAIQGRAHPDGTYTAVDYVEIWKAGAAALANSTLTVNDTTRRFYAIPIVVPFMQVVATRTTGTLTILGSYSSQPFSQWLLVNARGSVFVEGPTASDAAEAGNPVQVGGSVDNTSPAAATEGDVRRARVSPAGYQLVAFTSALATTPDAVGVDTVIGIKQIDDQDRRLATISFEYGFAPDGNFDRLRTVGDSGEGLGRLAVGSWGKGASEVTQTTVDVGATSASRQTLLTPTSGKKARIISVQVASAVLTTAPGRVSVYFGTGAAYTTTIANAIGEFVPTITGQQNIVFPDGGGPVGAVDAVVSGITETETETALRYTLAYREE